MLMDAGLPAAAVPWIYLWDGHWLQLKTLHKIN
jgi:hypothetical protein